MKYNISSTSVDDNKKNSIVSFNSNEKLVGMAMAKDFFAIGFENKVIFISENNTIARWHSHEIPKQDSLDNLKIEGLKCITNINNKIYCVHKNALEIIEIYIVDKIFNVIPCNYNKLKIEKDVGVVDLIAGNGTPFIISLENYNSIFNFRGDFMKIFGDYEKGCDICTPISMSSCNAPRSMFRYENGIVFLDSGNNMVRYFDRSRSEILFRTEENCLKMRASSRGIFILDIKGNLFKYDEDYNKEIILSNIKDFILKDDMIYYLEAYGK